MILQPVILWQERMSNEFGASVAPIIRSSGSITNMVLKSSPASENKRTTEPSTAIPSTSFSHLHFSKNRKIEESTITGGIEPCKNMKGVTKSGVNEAKPQSPTNPFAMASNKQVKTEVSKVTSEQNSNEKVDHISSKVTSDAKSSEKQSARPANPFAKSSNNQDKSSLLESIKKMRKAEHEKNEKISSKKIIPLME